MPAQIPTTDLFWFEPGFPEDLEAAIREAHPLGDIACQAEAQRLAKWIVQHGHGVDIHGGMFYAADEGDGEGHAWLVVDGFIFDPTAGQFDCFPEIEGWCYVSTEEVIELDAVTLTP